MAKFIPKAKLSKKTQKALNNKKRVTWEMNPVTRKTERKKPYSRKRKSCDQYDDYGAGFFMLFFYTYNR